MSRLNEIKVRLHALHMYRYFYNSATAEHGLEEIRLRCHAYLDAKEKMVAHAEEDLQWLIEENRLLGRAAKGLVDAILKMAAASERGVGDMMAVGTRETARLMEELRIGRTETR